MLSFKPVAYYLHIPTELPTSGCGNCGRETTLRAPLVLWLCARSSFSCRLDSSHRTSTEKSGKRLRSPYSLPECRPVPVSVSEHPAPLLVDHVLVLLRIRLDVDLVLREYAGLLRRGRSPQLSLLGGSDLPRLRRRRARPLGQVRRPLCLQFRTLLGENCVASATRRVSRSAYGSRGVCGDVGGGPCDRVCWGGCGGGCRGGAGVVLTARQLAL